MPPTTLHPYRTPAEVSDVIDAHHAGAAPAHAGHVIEALRRERTGASRFNGWLADHIVGLAGTMAFFYLLCAILGAWTLWQAGFEANDGFDPFPFAFLFFVLGGIMQSLFVPTMLVAANRATERQRIKDEIDHRDATHMYEVNDEQLRLLRLLIDRATAPA